MKKRIIIEEENNPKESTFQRIVHHPFFEWLLYMVGYTIVLITVSVLFQNHFYINPKHFGVYAFLASVIIYVLNQAKVKD